MAASLNSSLNGAAVESATRHRRAYKSMTSAFKSTVAG